MPINKLVRYRDQEPYDILDLAAYQLHSKNEAEDNSERIERLKRNLPYAINKLSPRQQQLVNLFYAREMTVTQIAEYLHVNKSTVTRTLQRAKKHLRDYLEFSL